MKYVQRILLLIILVEVTGLSHSQTITFDFGGPMNLGLYLIPDNSIATGNAMYQGYIGSSGLVESIGTFDFIGSDFDTIMNEGIILSSGNVQNAVYPESPASSDFGQPGYALLDSLDSSTLTYDVASIEFDFLAFADTVELKYIFASEEFGELSSMNDRMGIFLSGPIPGGGYYEDKNIALIPGTNLPVTVNNLQDTNFASLLNSTGDFLFPYDEPFAYNAYTDEFIATAVVVPGYNYTLKICVADGNDDYFDSAVFLRKHGMIGINSIGNGDSVAVLALYNPIWCHNGETNVHLCIYANGMWSLPIVEWDNGSHQIDSLLPAGTYTVTATDINQYSDSTIYSFTIVDGLAAIELNASFSDIQCAGDSTYVEFSVSGGAQPVNMPLDAFYQAGVFQFTAIDSNNCADTLTFILTEPDELNIDTLILPASSNSSNDGAIDLTITGGVAPYSFSWNNGETTEDLENLLSGSYSLELIDSHGCMITDIYNVPYVQAIEIDLESKIRIYPNPAGKEITIELNPFYIGGLINLQNIQGQTVSKLQVQNETLTISLENLTPGIYILEIRSNSGEIYRERVVKY